jgi:predicted regulator of Ras-like GTPase activity (Roadblock/LC7/MglB family)
MFGFLKNLLGKQSGSRPANLPVETTPVSPPGAARTPEAYAGGSRITPSYKLGAQGGGRAVEVPLRAILSLLPLELQPRVLHTEVGELSLAIPLEKILSQLSRGSVRITFGELRLAAPGIFSNESDRDRVMVTLPLGEILPKVNPALIQRRRVQKQVEVPPDITSPFDAHLRAIAPTPPPEEVEDFAPSLEVQEPVPAALPTQQPARSQQPGPFIRQITPAAAPAAAALPVRNSPPAPIASPIAMPPRSAIPFRSVPVAPVSPVAQPAPVPPAPPSSRGSHAGNGHQTPPPETISAPVQPKPVPVPEPFFANLSSLAEAWPDTVRREIVQMNLVDCKVGLPRDWVEQGLKKGKLVQSWKGICGWIHGGNVPQASPNDAVLLELPLRVIAPLFLARGKERNAPQQVVIDDNIPNLFFGFPEPGNGPAAVATPAPSSKQPDTNYYTADDTTDSEGKLRTDDHRIPPPSPGTSFVAKYATPNEIISRAAALDGVSGALIALPDGLLVASRLPQDLNADTLAAFLPQIFSKVSQCTRELRMGDLNNLNFTVGNVPWKIFRVNAIFFAAFGRPGEGLPTGQLVALAGELDHKPK